MWKGVKLWCFLRASKERSQPHSPCLAFWAPSGVISSRILPAGHWYLYLPSISRSEIWNGYNQELLRTLNSSRLSSIEEMLGPYHGRGRNQGLISWPAKFLGPGGWVIDVLDVSVVWRAGECPKAKIHGKEKKADIPTILNHRAGIELNDAQCQLSIPMDE